MTGSTRQDPQVGTRPKAFISWAHGGREWERTVLDFATALRRMGGIDADLDLWHFTSHESWTTYGPKAIAESDFILVAFDAAYKLRWEGDEEPGKGAGAAREAAAIKAIFERDQGEFLRRVKPVILPGADKEDIPNDVYGVAERFVVETFDEKGLDGLLRSMFGMPYDPKPPLGPLPALPPRFVDEIQQAPPPKDRQGAASESHPDAINTDEPVPDEAPLAARLEQLDNALKSFGPADTTGNMALQPNRHWDQLRRERAQVRAALEALQRSQGAELTVVEPGTASQPVPPSEVDIKPEREADDDQHPDTARGRREAEEHGLFDLCLEGRKRLAVERAQAAEAGETLWWDLAPSAGRWLGRYFAFWCKATTTPCDLVRYEFDQEQPGYKLGRYDSARFRVHPSRDGGFAKATVVNASAGFFSDDDLRLYCGITSWDFAHHWAELDPNAKLLLNGSTRPSIFGVRGRPAFPGIAGVHTLMVTSDGYIIFSLRSPGVRFYRHQWSASFEESVRLDKRDYVTDRPGGDRHVLDTVSGGLREEFGGHEEHVASHTLLAVGREYARVAPPDDDGRPLEPDRLMLHCSNLTAIRLTLDVEDLWWRMDTHQDDIPDLHEHSAWVGVRFASQEDLHAFLRFARTRVGGRDLFGEFRRTTGSTCDLSYNRLGHGSEAIDRGLMPTTAARLYLGAKWLGMGTGSSTVG